MKAGKGKVFAPEIVSLSLCDYPSEPALVIFFSGCNYDCGYCYNGRLKRQSKSHLTNVDKVLSIVAANSLITACKVTGGEPLLQLDPLKSIASFCKRKGLKFGIDTNGTFPEALGEIMGILDLVSIDVKTALNNEAYSKVCGRADPKLGSVKRSLSIALASSAYVDIRMVVIPGINDSPDVASSLSEDLIRLGYEAKASKGEASFTLSEFLPENADSPSYKAIRNTAPSDLLNFAKSFRLSNVRLSHRSIGFNVKA
uniref:Radical SAM protein n=1 Tax=Candidatus Methanomethylicus mesodigestus TaxID=1867258 RepID=A0A7C3J293_9CREN